MMRQTGFAELVVVILLAVVALTVVPVAWTGFMQFWWDRKVDDLCSHEPLVEIVGSVPVSEEQVRVMPRYNGQLWSFDPLDITKPESPAYLRSRNEVLRSDGPRVWIGRHEVVRKSDGVVVARFTRVNRLGGDVLPLGHPSSKTCPPEAAQYSKLATIFVRTPAK